MTRRVFCLALFFALAGAASAADGPVTAVERTARGMRVTTASEVMELQAWAGNSIRVQIAPGTVIPGKKSLVVIDAAPPGAWSFGQDDASARLTVGRLQARVDKKTGLLTFLTPDGETLLAATAGGSALQPAANPARDGLAPGQTFARDPQERFFGMGVISDALTKPSATVPLLNNNTRIQVPVLYSTRGYGVLWDNPSKGELDLTPGSVSWQSSAGDLIDYYVMAGPSADQVIAEYRALTGQAPLFPKWAYGFWFCKNRFKSQQEILDAATDFRAHRMPLDLLVQDYFYWRPSAAASETVNWGSHHFDPERYPDPKGMIAELHGKDHLHFMAVVWPKFDAATAHARELDAAGALFPTKPLPFYDPFGEKGRQIYGRQVMESLLPLGVDAFWVDASEPEISMKTFATFDSPAGPVSRIENAFPLMHTTALYQAQRAATADKRVVLLPRSSWAGMQRNAASNWTGDIRGDWKTLEWQIEGLQNYSIAGLPYITTDIGGYSPSLEADQEHFIRWFEWGAFCPIFRVHGVDRAFPWQYGPEAEAILRGVDDLRYRLLPAIYSDAADVTRHAGSIQRPLVMDFRTDAQAVASWDEFMFGPQLLVCPVHESRYERLPAGPGDFSDLDGKPGGLSVTYLKTGAEKPSRVEFSKGLSFTPPANRKPFHAARFEGSFTPDRDGPLLLRPMTNFGTGSLTLGGKTFGPPPAFQHIVAPFAGRAGVPVKFSFESGDFKPSFEIIRDRFNSGTPTRSVYLPAGCGWYDFWTGKKQAGGQTVTADAPLERIPLYVRAGSILPMGPKLQYAAEHPADPLELRVYEGSDCAFTLYEDEGDNYDYEKGISATIPMRWTEKTHTLTIGKRQGSFPGMLATRTFRVVWVKEGHGAGVDAPKTADVELTYDGSVITATDAGK